MLGWSGLSMNRAALIALLLLTVALAGCASSTPPAGQASPPRPRARIPERHRRRHQARKTKARACWAQGNRQGNSEDKSRRRDGRRRKVANDWRENAMTVRRREFLQLAAAATACPALACSAWAQAYP